MHNSTNEDVKNMFFDLLAGGAGVQSLIDHARRSVFHNPIMVTNEAFRVIGLSCERDFDDPVWNEARDMHGFSRNIIETFRMDDESRKLFHDRKMFLYQTGLAERIPRILAPLFAGNSMLGYLIIFAAELPITEADMERADILGQALKILLNRSAVYSDETLDLTDFTLKNLLKGAEINEEAISTLTEKHYYTAMSVSLPSDRKGRSYISYLREQLIGQMKDIRCFLYGGSLFLLLYYDDFHELHLFYERTESILKRYYLVLGASNHFTDIRKLQFYYMQAQNIRRIGKIVSPKEQIYRFRDYYIYYLISEISYDQYDSFICTDYQVLRKYDLMHFTNLTETIVSYYFHSLSVNEVSRAMHTHRNTISYRLHMIRDGLEVDYTDMRRLRNIVLSSEIEKWRMLRRRES